MQWTQEHRDMVRDLLDYAEAQTKLLAAYRIQGRPSGRTLDTLAALRESPSKVKQFLEETRHDG